MAGRRSFPIETFDALLRDLATFGLVQQSSECPSDSWELTEQARHRLGELVQPAAIPAPDKLVYLDHRCEDCHEHGVTRLRDGRYLCDECFEASSLVDETLEAVAPVGTPASDDARRGLWRRHARVVEGGGSLAS